MVESAGPVDLADYPCVPQGCCQNVSYPLSLIHHVDYLDAAQPSGVEWLTPRGGIKGCLIEIDSSGIVSSPGDHGFELAHIGIGVIEPVRHGNPAPRRKVSRIARTPPQT
jgi:hypothetical protein